MQNLIKIQEELKNVPLQAVMAYVEGKNPMVPPYLALTELNRRKQVQQSAVAQQQPQGTVKDQIQQQAGIMALQAARQQAAAQNMQQGMAATPQPGAAPAGPVQAAPVVKAASGGLMEAPIRSDMFKADSYAGGGIVAFNGRKGSKVEDDEEEDGIPVFDESGAYTGKTIPRSSSTFGTFGEGVADWWKRNTIGSPEYLKEKGIFTEAQAKAAREKQDLINQAQQKPVTPPAAPAAPAAAVPPAAPPAAPPASPSAGLGGYGPLMGMKPRSTSLDDIRKDQLKAQELTGVLPVEQRTAASDELYRKLKEQMMAQRPSGSLADLAESMGEGAAAGPYWWQSAAGYGKSAGRAVKARQELYNKQDEAFAALERAKEEKADALRRGDAKDLEKAKADIEKANFDLNKAKAETQYHREAIAQKSEGAEAKLDFEKEKLLETKDESYRMLKMRQASLSTRLAKDPNDKKAQEELRNIEQQIENKRRSAGVYTGGSAAPSAPSGKLVQNKDGTFSYQR